MDVLSFISGGGNTEVTKKKVQQQRSEKERDNDKERRRKKRKTKKGCRQIEVEGESKHWLGNRRSKESGERQRPAYPQTGRVQAWLARSPPSSTPHRCHHITALLLLGKP